MRIRSHSLKSDSDKVRQKRIRVAKSVARRLNYQLEVKLTKRQMRPFFSSQAHRREQMREAFVIRVEEALDNGTVELSVWEYHDKDKSKLVRATITRSS